MDRNVSKNKKFLTSGIAGGILGSNAATPLLSNSYSFHQTLLEKVQDRVRICIEGERQEEGVEKVVAKATYLHQSFQQVLQLPTVHLGRVGSHASHMIIDASQVIPCHTY